MNSVEELAAWLAAQRDAFPSSGVYMAARRGLRRLAAAEGRHERDVKVEMADAADALARAAGDGRFPKRSIQDEVSALRHLRRLPAPPSELLKRLVTGTATLADAISLAAQQESWGDERSRIASAIRRLALQAGAAPESLPATKESVERLLKRLGAGAFGLGPRAFGTFRSRILRAVKLVDLQSSTHVKASMLSGPWRALQTAADATGSARVKAALTKAWPLIQYCFAAGIDPEDVDDGTVLEMLTDLERRGRKSAFEAARNAIYSWETLQAAVPEWPRQALSRLYAGHIKTRPWTAFEDLPVDIQRIWEDYVARTCHDPGQSVAALVVDDDDRGEFDDLLEDEASANTTPGVYSPETLRQRRSVWLQCIAAATDLGQPIRSMGDVATPGVAKLVLERLGGRQQMQAKRDGQQWSQKNASRKNVAEVVRAFAADSGADNHTLEILTRMRDRVDPHLVRTRRDAKTGATKRVYSAKRMGKKPAEQLRQFTNPGAILALFHLPDHLISEAKRLMARPGHEQGGYALLITAIVHMILRDAPIRREDLARLRIFGAERELILPSTPRSGEARLSLTSRKTSVEIDMVLSAETTRLLQWWVRDVRPRFLRAVGARPDNPYLFPAGGETAWRAPETLNAQFRLHTRKFAGLSLNIHTMRHIVAKLILDQDPTQMELVRRLLGHTSVRTTESYYTEVNQLLCQRKVHELLDEARAGAWRKRGAR